MIKHQVDKDAGNGDIKPDRHRPFCNPAMFVPAALKYRDQSEDDERKGDEGKQNVASQDREINGRQPAAETGRFFAYLNVIGDVANEKQA